MAGSEKNARCECVDQGCPEHEGRECANVERLVTFYRADQIDETGTRFCEACAEDARGSGVYK